MGLENNGSQSNPTAWTLANLREAALLTNMRMNAIPLINMLITALHDDFSEEFKEALKELYEEHDNRAIDRYTYQSKAIRIITRQLRTMGHVVASELSPRIFIEEYKRNIDVWAESISRS